MKTEMTKHEWGFIYSSLQSLMYGKGDNPDEEEKAYNEKIKNLLVKVDKNMMESK